jgi:DNA-directed RNA polymerase subunit alpha
MLVIQRPKVEALSDADGDRQLFAISPLEPGFGHTLGNSLRRTLLSAITQVRFDDALHEFDTIKGITEDVTDIILNLKDLVLQVHSDEPVTLRLDVRGPQSASTTVAVTAGDIQTSSDVEILNKDLHIATLNSSARLAVDLTVEKGRGYVSANRDTGGTIGVIPVDSIFSPVRRVTFSVEPTRVEQSTAFDRLVLDIETDGSITAREALASAGATLRTLVQLVEEMSDEPQGLELGEVSGVAAGSPDLELPIEDLDLSERPRNCLKRAQVNTVGELLEKSEDDLLAITNFGQKSLDEVIQKLDERGLSLRNRD